MTEREIWLASALLEIADSLQVREQVYLDALVRRLSELSAPADVGALVTTDTGTLAVQAANSSPMRELLTIETRFKEGPCNTSHGTGRRLPPMRLDQVDNRWPRFAPAARRFGFGLASALPVRRNSDSFGAVCILAEDGNPLDDADLDLVAILVDAAAIGLNHQHLLRQGARRTAQLQHALRSRIVIEQAKGVVSARRGIAPDAAFEQLRRYARRNGRRLHDVAGDVVQGRVSDQELPSDDD